jgi:hypothetical protein
VLIEEAEFVILFGGIDRDGGGLAVGPGGDVNPVGPWGPAVAALAAAVGQLVRVTQALPENEAHRQVAHVAQAAVDVLAGELGLGAKTKTLMYVDDGAPWCGTGHDGKLHPGPLPTVWKHSNPLS